MCIYQNHILIKMPTYSYLCKNCQCDFELFFYIKDYIECPICINCKSKNTHRRFVDDVLTQSSSVKKTDSELKTIGDLAMRNSERMSDDEKHHLYVKHNSYKDNFDESKPLPKGMTRVKKQPKIKWPGTSVTKKRRKNTR